MWLLLKKLSSTMVGFTNLKKLYHYCVRSKYTVVIIKKGVEYNSTLLQQLLYSSHHSA